MVYAYANKWSKLAALAQACFLGRFAASSLAWTVRGVLPGWSAARACALHGHCLPAGTRGTRAAALPVCSASQRTIVRIRANRAYTCAYENRSRRERCVCIGLTPPCVRIPVAVCLSVCLSACLSVSASLSLSEVEARAIEADEDEEEEALKEEQDGLSEEQVGASDMGSTGIETQRQAPTRVFSKSETIGEGSPMSPHLSQPGIGRDQSRAVCAPGSARQRARAELATQCAARQHPPVPQGTADGEGEGEGEGGNERGWKWWRGDEGWGCRDRVQGVLPEDGGLGQCGAATSGIVLVARRPFARPAAVNPKPA